VRWWTILASPDAKPGIVIYSECLRKSVPVFLYYCRNDLGLLASCGISQAQQKDTLVAFMLVINILSEIAIHSYDNTALVPGKCEYVSIRHAGVDVGYGDDIVT